MQKSILPFRLRAVSALAPFLFVFSAYAQTGPAPAAGPVGEVSFDLVAHDKKGATVRDLKPGDFAITADGSPVHIDDLHMVTGGPGPGHAQLVALVFAHDNPGYARVARDVAVQLIKAAPPTGILFAVLRVDGRLRLIQEFTTDREALTKAIDGATVNYDRDDNSAEKRLTDLKAGVNKEDPTLSKVLLNMLLDSQTLARDPHTPPAIASLEAACRQMGVLPGRKTLVYFSSGLDWDISDPEMPSKVAAAAIRGRVSIYSVDAEILDPHSSNALLAGLSVSSALSLGGIGGGTGGTGAAGVATQIVEQVGRIQAGDINTSESRLSAICHATGGEHATDSGNIQKTVQRIVDDVTSSYSAYFVPPTGQGGKFRTIRIKTLRPGLSIEARGAYFPVHGITSLAVSPAGEKLLAALAAPELPSGLEFHSSVLRFESTPMGTMSAVALEVPVSQITANVLVLAQVRDQTGAIVERYTEDIHKSEARAAHNGAVSVERHFLAAPGSYVLESAAMDEHSGKIGAQRTKFEIPPPANGPTLGDIVLVRHVGPAGGAADPAEPLHCNEGKVIPNLSGRLARDTNPAILLFFFAQPDTSSADQPALKLEVMRDGNLLGSVPLSLHTDAAAPGIVRELAKIGTKTLQPGTYDLTVALTQGARTVERTTSVTLE
jgi:VWFA-related protein